MSAALKLEELDALWKPFTANRAFKAAPRLYTKAEGMYYTTVDGKQVLDATAGLWCCAAGNGRKEIADAIAQQAAQMYYSPAFQMGHPLEFQLANEIKKLSPEHINHALFTNSGSESVDSALKIALAYHKLRGEGGRTRFIGRERGYHGVGFGGISVGGMVLNRHYFGNMLNGVDHLPHTHDLQRNAFSRGLPKHGLEKAEVLEDLVALHGASTIAAVIVEPIAGSTGVLMPPEGYLQRIQEICHKHGILLIFDEVITGYGRLGTPFAAQYFDCQPDMITTAKGLTSGSVPMGAVLVADNIYQSFMEHSPTPIELFHGYTYSGHPIACAAALATLQLYEREQLFARVSQLAPVWEEQLHRLRASSNHIIDIRNLGLIGAVELQPRSGAAGARANDVFLDCFKNGLQVRVTGDTIALSPPFIISEEQIAEIMSILAAALGRVE